MKASLLIVAAAVLAGCSGPYDDLGQAFVAKTEPKGTSTDVRRLVLVSTRHRGALSYDRTMAVSLTADTVEIRPKFPFSLIEKGLDLPASQVSGCAMTCFGVQDQHVDLLFEEHGADISFDVPSQFIDWCWRNNLPMFSGDSKRGWLYSGRPLPTKTGYVQVAKESYEKQAYRACLGY
ncbi:MAG: hypothetical protein F9K30_18985 [Dechloromonas sp.]|nr:MAG: hypothetical protein F9K30_18985 [Dechloromonas sp.]